MNLDKIIRSTLIFGIFLVPFIPFIVVNSTYFPFITGKNFAFRILVEIIFALWLILAIRNPTYRPTFSWIGISVATFLGIVFIADLFGINPSRSIWSNFERMEGFITLVHLGAYFVVLGTVLNTQRIWTWFFNTTVGASVLMAMFGLYQLGGFAVINQGGVRLDGRFGNATYLSIYMVFHIFITALLLARWRGGNFVRYMYGVIILVEAFVLFHTATRGSILGFLGGLLLASLIIIIFERERLIFRKIGLGILVTVVVVVGGFFFIKDADFVSDSPVLSRFSGISLESGTAQSRFIIWGMAWEGFKERPLLGYGQDNFNIVFNKFYDPMLHGNEPWFDRVHNILFDWLINAGILGLLSYISLPLILFAYILFGKHKLSVIEKGLLVGVIAAYGFNNLFVFDNLVSYIMFFTILAYVYCLSRPPVDTETKWGTSFDTGTVDRLVAPAIIILLVLTIHFVNTKPILATTTLLDALRGQPEGLERNLQFFSEALSYGSFGNQEIREQLVQAASGLSNQDIDPIVRQAFFDLARTEMEKQIEDSAPDARLELFIAALFDAYQLYDLAAPHYELALELSPQKQSLRFALGSSLLNRNRNEEALILFKETVELAPEFNQAHIFYATGAIYSQQRELADQILQNQFGTTTIDDDRLLRAYADSGQFDRAREILKIRVQAQPDNQNLRLSIAGLYIQEGNTDEAIAEIRAIMIDFPDFQAQGEAIIDEIQSGTVQ